MTIAQASSWAAERRAYPSVRRAAGGDTAQLARSDRRLFARLDRAPGRLAEEPAAGKPLAGRLAGHRSLRVGSLQIVHRVSEARREVLVPDIGQRGGVYR